MTNQERRSNYFAPPFWYNFAYYSFHIIGIGVAVALGITIGKKINKGKKMTPLLIACVGLFAMIILGNIFTLKRQPQENIEFTNMTPQQIADTVNLFRREKIIT